MANEPVSRTLGPSCSGASRPKRLPCPMIRRREGRSEMRFVVSSWVPSSRLYLCPGKSIKSSTAPLRTQCKSLCARERFYRMSEAFHAQSTTPLTMSLLVECGTSSVLALKSSKPSMCSKWRMNVEYMGTSHWTLAQGNRVLGRELRKAGG